MFDFKNRKIDENSRAEYTFGPGLRLKADADPPTFVCAPASAANKPFWNAFKALESRHAGKRADEEKAADYARLFAEHIVKGWRDVYDEKGNAVDFCRPDGTPDTERVFEFLHQVALYLPDEFIRFTNRIAEPSTFRVVTFDGEALGKS